MVKDNENGFFTRKREAYFPLQFVILGYMLVLLGLYLLFSLNLLGLLAIAGGIIVSFSYVGIQIDFKKNYYREYLGLFVLKFGKWSKLEKIQYVTVFIDNVVQEMHVVSISSTQAIKDFRVNLVISKTNRISIGNFSQREKAMEAAGLLAGKLSCKFLDYTSGKPIWIE